MNKTILGGVAVLLLVISFGSNLVYHSAEARGMPQHWLKGDGTVKQQYLLVQKGTSPDRQYPVSKLHLLEDGLRHV